MSRVVDLKLIKYQDPGKNCFFTVVGTYLATKGLSKRDLDLIFGFGLRYYLKIEAQGEVCIFNNTAERVLEFIEIHLGISIKHRADEDYRNAWQSLQNRIDHGELSIVGASIYYLPYHKNYQKEHYPHYLFVMGYDIDSKSILIEDVFFDFKGGIGFENFVNGHNISFFDRRNTTLEITCPDKFEEMDLALLRDLFIKNLQNLQGDVEVEGFGGLAAIRKFKEWLNENFDQLEMITFKKMATSMERFYQEADRHVIFVRELYEELALIDCVTDLSKHWKIMMNSFIKASIKKASVSVNSLNKTLDHICELIESYVSIVSSQLK